MQTVVAELFSLETERLSVVQQKWSLTAFCCKYAHVYGILTTTGMQSELPGVWACAYLCVCVCICECVDCALAFTAVPRYHENTSRLCSSGSSSSWTSHLWLYLSPSFEGTGSWWEKSGKRERERGKDREVREKLRRREEEGGRRKRMCVVKRVVKIYS